MPRTPTSGQTGDVTATLVQRLQTEHSKVRDELGKIREEGRLEQADRRAEETSIRKELKQLRKAVGQLEVDMASNKDDLTNSLQELRASMDQEWKVARTELETRFAALVHNSRFEELAACVDEQSESQKNQLDQLASAIRGLQHEGEKDGEDGNNGEDSSVTFSVGSGVPFRVGKRRTRGLFQDELDETPKSGDVGCPGSPEAHAMQPRKSRLYDCEGPRVAKLGTEQSFCPTRPSTMGGTFWKQQRGRPRRLIFIRHGQSEANVDRDLTKMVPDHDLHLTDAGRGQALEAGKRLHTIVGDGTVKYLISPYVRTCETANGILWGLNDKRPPEAARKNMRYDVRIREIEYGNYDREDMQDLHAEKSTFGAFYYRFPEGESPADCYDRASIFLETLYRMWEDNSYENYVVVSHGLMILVMVMRLLRVPVEEFENLASLDNCEFVVLERHGQDPKFHIAYTWKGEGAEKDTSGLRHKPGKPKDRRFWDGNPEAPSFHSKPAPERVEFIQNRVKKTKSASASMVDCTSSMTLSNVGKQRQRSQSMDAALSSEAVGDLAALTGAAKMDRVHSLAFFSDSQHSGLSGDSSSSDRDE